MGQIEVRNLVCGGEAGGAFESILFSSTHAFAFDQDQGRLRTAQYRYGNPGIRIGRVMSSGHQISLTENQNVTLLMPRKGALSIRIAGRDIVVPGSGSALLRPNTRTTHVRAPEAGLFDGLVLMLPEDALRQIALDAGIESALRRDLLPAKAATTHRLASYLDFLIRDLALQEGGVMPPRTAASLDALLRDLLADWLTDAAEAASSSAVDLLRVRRAEEIFMDRADEVISIAEVARELGLSLRSLQAAFHAVMGVGPKARLTHIRLERARASLLMAEPEEQVTAIALDCGFTHLSRFAEAYFRTYGERPSETLARKRRLPNLSARCSA
jgi:AraC-like DNA-binding protein